MGKEDKEAVAVGPSLARAATDPLPSAEAFDATLRDPSAPPMAAPQGRRSVSGAMARASAEGRIGDYLLLRKLGEGGMGQVWEAEQEGALRRRVALKMIKAGHASEQILLRFEAERQALAMMDHPYVARVHDAGSSDEGIPYFVMDLVEGSDLISYADEEELSVDERLRLFIRVCEGVQHAHQKAIIHRDLKPSNVLVSDKEGEAIPRIIDFGLAKAMGDKLTEQTLETAYGALVGTPAYMSPEQAAGTAIDTRADVYSLGALLYELVAGLPPFDFSRQSFSGLESLLQGIREKPAPRPSARLSQAGEQQQAIARHRKQDVAGLRRRLEGDLDWVCLKALEKEVDRRYASAAALGEELQRILDDQPVVARPPSRAYRFGKFVRRHRLGVLLSAMIVMLLIAFASVTAIQAARLASERDRANLEANSARRLSDFLLAIFEESAPDRAQGREVTARELLDVGAARLGELADEPRLQARLQSSMGNVYYRLGFYGEAARLLGAARATHERLLGAEAVESLQNIHDLGLVARAQGDYEGAERLYRQAHAGRRKTLGDSHTETLNTLNSLANVLLIRGELEQAQALYEELLLLRETSLGPEHPDTLMSLANLANFWRRKGAFDKAEPLYRRTLSLREKVRGPKHPETLSSMHGLGRLLKQKGEIEEGRSLLERALAARSEVLGEAHPQTLATLEMLGNLLLDAGHVEEAEACLEQSFERRNETLGEFHPDTLVSMSNLANFYLVQEDYAPAEKLLSRAVDAYAQARNPDTGNAAIAKHNLACALTGLERYAEAEALFREVEDLFEQNFGAEHPLMAENLEQWARLLQKTNRLNEAQPMLERAKAIRAQR